jgi:hypothetical protein
MQNNGGNNEKTRNKEKKNNEKQTKQMQQYKIEREQIVFGLTARCHSWEIS